MRALKFLSQKGMTLPEIMIAAALLGGIGLVAAKLMSDQANNQNYLKAMSDIASTVSRLESLLNNPETCKQMLFNQQVSASGSPLGTSGVTGETLLGFSPPQGGTVKVIAEKNYGSFEIKDNGMRLQTSVYGATITDLVIDFSMTGQSFLTSGRDTYTRRIPIVTQLDASDKIEDCGPVLKDSESIGQEKMCESLGNAAYWDGSKCLLNSVKCPYNQVATKMTSLGGIICVPIAGQINLNTIFDTNGINCIGKPNLQIINVGGKFKVNCY